MYEHSSGFTSLTVSGVSGRLNSGHFNGCLWYLIVICICIFLVMVMFSIFVSFNWQFVYLPLCSVFSLLFIIWVVFLLFSCRRSLYRFFSSFLISVWLCSFETSSLNVLKYFLPVCALNTHILIVSFDEYFYFDEI